MKKILLFILLLMLPLVYGQEECGPVIEGEDIPCYVTSLWNYTPPCSQWNATVYNSTGENVINYSFQDWGDSNLCYYTWNITTLDSYIYQVENGDSGSITVGADNMLIASILGIGIIAGILFFFAFKLENEYIFLRMLCLFEGIAVLTLIPSVLITHNISVTLNQFYMRFLIVFWVYVFVHLVYRVLIWLGVVVPKEKKGNEQT